MSPLLFALLAFVGEPAQTFGPDGSCPGTVVAPGVVAFAGCSPAPEATLYLDSSDEPVDAWTLSPGGRVATFTPEQLP
jgi:hypothetical protein